MRHEDDLLIQCLDEQAHALGVGEVEQGGRLVEGHLADFVTVRLDSARTAGCGPDQVGYAATSADVTDVVIGGEHLVQRGVHRLGDVGELLQEALSQVRTP